MRREEVPNPARLSMQALDPGALLRCIILRLFRRVPCPVGLHHLRHGLLHALGLTQEFGVGAAPLLVGVARELYAVNGKHLPADQALAIAGEKHTGEDRRSLLAQLTHERRNRRELRSAVTRDRHEQHILTAQALDPPAGDNAAAVGEEHDLEHHRRIVGRGARFIVTEALRESREVNLGVNENVERVLKAAGNELGFEDNREETGTAVDQFEARHFLVLHSGRCL